MNIIDFCEKNKIMWRPLKLEITMKNGKKKKDIKTMGGVMPDVNDFKNAEWVANTLPKLQKFIKGLSVAEKTQYHIAIDTSKIYHLDVDWLETKKYSKEATELIDDLIEKCPYYKSTTKKLGKHILFKLDEKMTLNRKEFPKDEYADLELLCGNWGWSPVSNVVINSELDIPTISLTNLPINNNKKTFKVKSQSKSKKVNIGASPEVDKNSKLFKYADMIDIKYLDDYNDWWKIIMALKTENEKNLAEYISRKSRKFERNVFLHKWDSYTCDYITIRSINYYAKISNPVKYRELQLSLIQEFEYEFMDSDDTLAKIFLDNKEQDIIYKNGEIYLYIGNPEGTKGSWFHDEKLERTKKIMSDELSAFWNCYHKLLIQKCKDANEEDKEEITANKKFIYKLIKSLKNCAKINSITEKLKQLLSVRDFTEIEFDKNGKLFPFNNACYDLSIHSWVGTRRDNYILNTCGYNWENPTDEQLKTIDNLFIEIFPNPHIRKEYLHYLATGLFGEAVEKFIIANGGGGNGKGVINDLMIATGGNFAYIANNAVLLSPVAAGGNPAIANMSGKRFINYREPDETKHLIISTIKELTGGGAIAARKLYSNEDSVELVGTHILETNKKPPMKGDLGDSVLRRLKDIPFEATYTTNKDLLKNKTHLKNIFKANPYYKTKEFQFTHKYALFQYLIDYIKTWEDNSELSVVEKLYECDEVVQRTKNYIEDNDPIYTILKEHFVLDNNDKNAFIRLANQFMPLFKDSEFYKTLSKYEQNKQYSEKNVLEHIAASSTTKIYFHSRYSPTINNVKKNYHKVLRFWRFKTDAEREADLESEDELEFI